VGVWRGLAKATRIIPTSLPISYLLLIAVANRVCVAVAGRRWVVETRVGAFCRWQKRVPGLRGRLWKPKTVATDVVLAHPQQRMQEQESEVTWDRAFYPTASWWMGTTAARGSGPQSLIRTLQE
jgi:hypothetical protein